MGRGRAHPVGVRVVDGGANVSVFAENADAVELLVFDEPTAPAPARVVPLTRDYHFWHAFVPGLAHGATYAFRARGPAGPQYRFDGDKALLDPYARRVETSLWRRKTGPYPPRPSRGRSAAGYR